VQVKKHIWHEGMLLWIQQACLFYHWVFFSAV